MRARVIASGEIKEIIKADFDENGKQLMVRGKPMPTHIDKLGFPFPVIISSKGEFLDNGTLNLLTKKSHPLLGGILQ